MKDMGIIKGTKESALPLIIGKTKVYVHTDIKEEPRIEIVRKKDDEGNVVEEEVQVGTIYTYHEVQYDKDEFLLLQAEEKSKMEEELADAKGTIDSMQIDLAGAYSTIDLILLDIIPSIVVME